MSLPQISKEQIAVGLQDVVQFKPCRWFKQTAIENPFGVSAREEGRNSETQFVEEVCARQSARTCDDGNGRYRRHRPTQPLVAVGAVKTGRAVAFGSHGRGPDEDHIGQGTQACEQGLVGRPAQGWECPSREPTPSTLAIMFRRTRGR